MKNKLFLLSIGLLTISGLILGKKTGLLKNDDHLYDEYDTSK
ncbi:methanol dehydrogenase (plasmid) [Enterococcus sp. 22-H-5-01]